MKLGKKARRHDPRTLKLARYMTALLPPAPASVDYTRGTTDWGMMLNDQLGDCIIADGPGHATQVWTLNATGTMATPPDSLILATYEKWCGYNPANSATDQGGVELDVLNDWRQQGFNGQTLEAYVAIGLESGIRSPKSEVQGGKSATSDVGPRTSDCPSTQLLQAIWLFGGAYVGVELPIRAQDQDVWDVPATLGPDDEPESWGGHAIYLVGYDVPEVAQPLLAVQGKAWTPFTAQAGVPVPPQTQAGVPVPPTLTCITWGGLKKMTWAWFEKYCSEAYALVSKDWLNASGVSPSGFDLAALESDLKLVTA
jgi:hypothetical protein